MMYFDPDRASVLRGCAQRLADTQQFPGLAWCVELQGRVVEEGAAGYRDPSVLEPLAADTIYRLYSMTKPVISAYCLQQIERGRLQLNDPVARWLPAFTTQKVMSPDGRLQNCQRPITVEDLLTHRAGLSYDFLPDCPVADEYRAARLAENGSRSLQDLTSILAGLPLAFQPGERWYYSYSTDVLARLLEVIADRPLDVCLKEALFDPLDMRDTGFQVPSPNVHRLARMFGQRALGEAPQPTDGIQAPNNSLLPMNVDESYPVTDPGFLRGGIGLYSTISDYRSFVHAMMCGKTRGGETVLSQPMLDMAWTNRLSPGQMPIAIGANAYPGYGWGLAGRVMVDPAAAVRLSAAGEAGWAGAASTYFWVDRARQFSGVVMTQYLGSEHTLGPDMQALAYAALVHTP